MNKAKIPGQPKPGSLKLRLRSKAPDAHTIKAATSDAAFIIIDYFICQT
jgi:hypothetical protein